MRMPFNLQLLFFSLACLLLLLQFCVQIVVTIFQLEYLIIQSLYFSSCLVSCLNNIPFSILLSHLELLDQGIYLCIFFLNLESGFSDLSIHKSNPTFIVSKILSIHVHLLQLIQQLLIILIL